MMRYSFLLVLLLLTVPAVAQPAAEDSKSAGRPTVAVLGMSNEVVDDAWSDVRIGMGVRALLAQLVYETGSFTLLEEKAGIRQQLLELSSGIWTMDGGSMEPVVARLNKLEPDYAVYGRVLYFGRPRTRMSFGALHGNTQKTEIRVEVTLHHLKSGLQLEGHGKGVSRTTANSVLFTFREDNVAFDESNVGNATKEALASAIQDVMKKFSRF